MWFHSTTNMPILLQYQFLFISNQIQCAFSMLGLFHTANQPSPCSPDKHNTSTPFLGWIWCQVSTENGFCMLSILTIHILNGNEIILKWELEWAEHHTLTIDHRTDNMPQQKNKLEVVCVWKWHCPQLHKKINLCGSSNRCFARHHIKSKWNMLMQ